MSKLKNGLIGVSIVLVLVISLRIAFSGIQVNVDYTAKSVNTLDEEKTVTVASTASSLSGGYDCNYLELELPPPLTPMRITTQRGDDELVRSLLRHITKQRRYIDKMNRVIIDTVNEHNEYCK